MKTLMKISLCLVMGLFVSFNVLASDPPAIDGTITCEVVRTLEICVDQTSRGDAYFKYDEHGTDNDLTDKTVGVKIKATVDWLFSINAQAGVLTGSTNNTLTLALNNFNYSYTTNGATVTGEALSTVGSTSAGSLNDEFPVSWATTISGNHYSDIYTVGVQYKVVEQ